jgi:hypothetical protein
MKIRNGFVTNSSSSSFLIAIKVPTEDQLKSLSLLDCYPAIHTMFNVINGLFDVEANDVTSLNKWFTDRHRDYKNNTLKQIIENNPSLKERYKKYLEYINDGMSIFYANIDYNETQLINKISDLNDGKNIIILETW